MKVTVCQLNDDPDLFLRDWDLLSRHVARESSDLVLLSELPFHPWLPRQRQFDAGSFQAALSAHDFWVPRLQELAPTIVLGSRPVTRGNKRLNQGFLWSEHSYHAVHEKVYLPAEEGFWETSWYDRGEKEFKPIDTDDCRIGILICTELWFTEHARHYGKEGAHIVAVPRVTERATLEKWLLAGRAGSIVSGAFCLSSNRFSADESPEPQFGGQGWIINPDGRVLGLTSEENPFVTVEIDLREAERAKETYPRDVAE